MLKFGLMIKGASESGIYRRILSPYDSRIVGEVEVPLKADYSTALQNAFKSFQSEMKAMPAWRRAEILYKVADKIKNDKELLAQTIAAEGGKPVKDARIEVVRAANTVKMSADAALNLNGEQISMDRSAGSEQHLAFTIKQGLGVVLAISAFNHPVNLICHQVATAFAAGNSVIVKPASQTPLSCMLICSYFLEAGLSEGIINVLPISGGDMEKIIPDSRIRFVSFIGSAEVGWKIPKIIAPGTGYSLEHGGTASAIVEKSADLEFAATSIVKGGFYHAGQVCVSTQNVFVHNSVYDDFIDLLIHKTSDLVTGDPNDGLTDVGPIISESEKNRILSQIGESVNSGAVCHIGGEIVDSSCISPAILTNTNYEMAVMKSEVFGPVINVNKYDKLENVIEECNKTPFSFQNSIYTSNINAAFHFAKKIDSKTVVINDSTAFRVDWMPFGGSKESGFKVGGVKYSIEDVIEEKLIVVRTNAYDA